MRFSAPNLIETAALGTLAALALPACVAGNLEDPRSLPEAPRPTTMAELTHPDGEGTIEETAGVVSPRGNGDTGHVGVSVARIAVEQPVYSRLVFVGGTYEAAYGEPSAPTKSKILSGNLEAYGRAVWATRTGLAFGGGLGFLFPTAHFDGTSPIQGLADGAIALRPWDYAFFQDNLFAVRPFVDMRYLVGPVTLQLRETFDGTFGAQGRSGFDVDVESAFFAAVRPRQNFAVGIELAQLYRVSANIPDADRSDFTIAPMIRLIFPRLQPFLAFQSSLGDPYYGGAEHAYSLKTGLTALW